MAIDKLYTFREIIEDGIEFKVDENNAQGETETHHVEISHFLIPKIQRSYAQGRLEENQVRESILKEMFDALINQKDVEFSFVYGSFREKRDDKKAPFEVLDGQQRLTTIFLLNVYIQLMERGSVFEWMNGCFLYETRKTSSDFIQKLLELKHEKEDGKSIFDLTVKPSDYISSKLWYTNAYKLDSTVEAMIVMLDAINVHYLNYATSLPEGQSPDLVGALDHLKFYALPLQSFDLTEDLYIKMNARGLPLTPYENFKANLIGYLKPSNKEDEIFYTREREWLDFASNLDVSWIDIFWSRNDSSDRDYNNRFFRLFYRWCALLCLLKKDIRLPRKDDENEETVGSLYEFFATKSEAQSKKDVRYLGFDNYKQLLQLTSTSIFHKEEDGQPVPEKAILNKEDIAIILSTIYRYGKRDGDNMILKSVNAPWETNREMFGEGYDYGDKTIFAAILLFILANHAYGWDKKMQTENPEKDMFAVSYARWMRFVHNIVENTDIRERNYSSMVAHLVALLNLMRENANIYIALTEYAPADTFDSIKYESEKANLILSHPGEDFEAALEKIESSSFFRGYANCFFTEEEAHNEKFSAETIEKRFSVADEWFNASGINTTIFPNYGFIRSMIASISLDSTMDLWLCENQENLKDAMLKPWARYFLTECLDKENPAESLKLKMTNFDLSAYPDTEETKFIQELVTSDKLWPWVDSETYIKGRGPVGMYGDSSHPCIKKSDRTNTFVWYLNEQRAEAINYLKANEYVPMTKYSNVREYYDTGNIVGDTWELQKNINGFNLQINLEHSGYANLWIECTNRDQGQYVSEHLSFNYNENSNWAYLKGPALDRLSVSVSEIEDVLKEYQYETKVQIENSEIEQNNGHE